MFISSKFLKKDLHLWFLFNYLAIFGTFRESIDLWGTKTGSNKTIRLSHFTMSGAQKWRRALYRALFYRLHSTLLYFIGPELFDGNFVKILAESRLRAHFGAFLCLNFWISWLKIDFTEPESARNNWKSRSFRASFVPKLSSMNVS